MASIIATHPFFTLTDGATLTFTGQADRYHKNIQAITLLRQLQAAGRQPTDLTEAEQLTLAHYTAFGESALLRRALGADATDLDSLISIEEARALKRASLNAFYRYCWQTWSACGILATLSILSLVRYACP